MRTFAVKLTIAVAVIVMAILLSVQLPTWSPEPYAVPAYAHPTPPRPYVDESPSSSDLEPIVVIGP